MILSFHGLFLSPLLLLLLTYFNCFTIARVLDSNCSHADTFAIGSPFESNLYNLFNSLFNDALLHNGFSNKSYGSQPNEVYGLVMCYAFSVYPTSDNLDCAGCLRLATSNVTLPCPTSATATVFYDSCLLSYSRKNFFSVAEPYIPSCLYSTPHQLDYNTSNSVVEALSRIVPNTTQRYSSIDRSRSFSATIECTKDLPSQECATCISNAMSHFHTCSFNGTALGTKILTRNCYILYESYLEDNLSWSPLSLTPSLPPQGPQLPQSPPPPPPPSPPPAPSPGSKSNSTVATIVAILLAVLVAVGLAVLGTYYWRSKCSVAKGADDDDDMNNLHENVETELEYILNPSAEYQVFNFAILKTATDNFSDMNKLGKGGFGPVYKGTLPDGREIAVKRLSGGSVQGITEFKNEVNLLAKLKHKNLVQLLGCCMTNKEKLLCYEYLPNGSLDKILFEKDPSKQVNNFGWRMRHKIIEGITRGLHYLHEESRFKIVHRDLKVSNILLDKDMNAKISDFGIARFFEEDETQKDTNLIAGTFGYMAPEYILRGNFSTKSDVYSFGVLLLEIVTGQKNSSFTGSNRISNLVDHALILWKGNKISELKDPMLEDEFNDEIGRCVHIALLCVQEDPVNRPHMETVRSMLASPSMSMPSLPSNLSVTYLTDYGRDSNMTTDTSTLRSQAESSITNTLSDESQAESSGTRNTITRNN